MDGNMKVLHGAWIPDQIDDPKHPAFVRGGGFCLWIEDILVSERPNGSRLELSSHLSSAALLSTFQGLSLSLFQDRNLQRSIVPRCFLLPSLQGQLVPTVGEVVKRNSESPILFNWGYCQIACCDLTWLLQQRREVRSGVSRLLHTLDQLIAEVEASASYVVGMDLQFWHAYLGCLHHLVNQEQYVPTLRLRPGRSQEYDVFAGWEIISKTYEESLDAYIEAMPGLARSGFAQPLNSFRLQDAGALLRHFAEWWLSEVMTSIELPPLLLSEIKYTPLEFCFRPPEPIANDAALQWTRQWHRWQQNVIKSQKPLDFNLYLQAHAPTKQNSNWTLQLQIGSYFDPSDRIPLRDYWKMRSQQDSDSMMNRFGEDSALFLLTQIGLAARIYPKLVDALNDPCPSEIELSIDEADAFLQTFAWRLAIAGHKITVPANWTPDGWRRFKLQLRATAHRKALPGQKGNLSAEVLVNYQYQLSLDGQPIDPEEWAALVRSKSELVQFRGQWVHLDRSRMQETLKFWQQHKAELLEVGVLDFMKLAQEIEADPDSDLELQADAELREMLAKLQGSAALELSPNPQKLKGTLRPYQQRGLSWIAFLETAGLNGCLADDMGLGKSLTVISRLVQERETNPDTRATMLIAPTSVLGNWQKEFEKFAPHLTVVLHHGTGRVSEMEALMQQVKAVDVVLTSFATARRDLDLLSRVRWHRIVVDEAQNIKNPVSAQTTAICSLPAQHRLALTGTPIENRLMDLWSIFNFLNPGYLGTKTSFRKSFEVPISQAEESSGKQADLLRRLIEPFVLRRLKTDPTIIQDLPEKLEQKLYCNLTREQASLYEAVVRDVEVRLQDLEGIQRKGVLLGTLTKLKQICNHPMQFLQDGSDFLPSRSHKLGRLVDMTQELIEEGDSVLVFTQFTEIGDALEKYFSKTLRWNTYYLHGGTSQKSRQRMITEFQSPQTGPSIFILSLKAGGVGVTLTKANHVFHFDRWWNPAVEDQASDRAFRIGQNKNVFVHKFVAIGTLEERIDQMIEKKKQLAESVVGGDESWLTELDNKSFRELIALSRQAVLT